MEYYLDIYYTELLKPLKKKNHNNNQKIQQQANTVSSWAGLNCV